MAAALDGIQGFVKRSMSLVKHHSPGSPRSSGEFERSGSPNGSPRRPLTPSGEEMSKSQFKKYEQREMRRRRMSSQKRLQEELKILRQREDERAKEEESAEVRARYGSLDINQSKLWAHEGRNYIKDISEKDVGRKVIFRVRLHNIRSMSGKLVFVVLRQQEYTMQGVLTVREGQISPHMVKWVERLEDESICVVKGIVQDALKEVTGSTVHKWELQIEEVHLVSAVTQNLPFHPAEAEIQRIPGKEKDEQGRPVILSSTRFNNRIIDLRSTSSQAIFRIQSGVGNAFRTYLDSQGFIEIHTPKLQGAATESGASVFKVDYFGRNAFLAQSPQLAKQMMISADFERVYEIGAVFRAEDSNTNRHLTEYTGLDIEMAIEEHYHEALKIIDGALKNIFSTIYTKYRHEVELVKKHFPSEDLVWLDETPVIPFKEGIALLRDSGYVDENGAPPSDSEDLGTRDEIRLGELIKEKYRTDYYILDKFPRSARPFYAMPSPEDPEATNSFDIFLRGQEILSGGQRVHMARLLEEHMREAHIAPEDMADYLEGFDWAAPPHAGGGIGLERLVMLMLKLGNIRNASLLHRDPKSLPARPVVEKLRHPEAATFPPPWDNKPEKEREAASLQPLEKLIANYGDATNTAWLDERYLIWRDDQTGAAVGYVPSGNFAIILGNPLCDASQYARTIHAFLRFLKSETKLKPIWLLVSKEVEEILGVKLGWTTVTCAAEARVSPQRFVAQNSNAHANANGKHSEVNKKIRQAERAGVKIHKLEPGTVPPQWLQEAVNLRVKDWLANRHGPQAHLTNINPWKDPEHRIYFYATAPLTSTSDSNSPPDTPSRSSTINSETNITGTDQTLSPASSVNSLPANIPTNGNKPANVLSGLPTSLTNGSSSQSFPGTSTTQSTSRQNSLPPNRRIVALVALAQLSPAHGYQLKYSLDFPHCPPGTIESIIEASIRHISTLPNQPPLTLGGAASASFQPVHHLGKEISEGHSGGSMTFRVLAKTYKGIRSSLNLDKKTEFKEKLGAVEEKVYVAYPRGGMGPRAVKAILNFFQSEEGDADPNI